MLSNPHNTYVVEFGVRYSLPNGSGVNHWRWFQREFDSLETALIFAHDCTIYWIWNKTGCIARSAYEVHSECV